MAKASKYSVQEGGSYPRGAHWDGKGVNFALFSAHATKVELCLFSEDGKSELAKIALPEFTNEIWHGYIPGLGSGQRYGYRVHGAYEPQNGHEMENRNWGDSAMKCFGMLMDGRAQPSGIQKRGGGARCSKVNNRF